MVQGKIKFNSSTGVRLVSNIIVFQYRQSETPECSTCSCDEQSKGGGLLNEIFIIKIVPMYKMIDQKQKNCRSNDKTRRDCNS